MGGWNKRHRLLARWTLVSTVILLVAISWTLANRTTEEAVLPGAEVDGLTSVLTRELTSDPSPIRFEEVGARLGVTFRHFPFKRTSLLPEDMGSGVAVADYDGDGWPDVFFVNCSGNVTPDGKLEGRTARAQLYRNVNGDHFEDVTDITGVGFVGIGMGAAWGDFDNDGDLDLYVTAFGPNALYENLGDGTFREITDRAGVQDGRFSAGCSWADYDRDGDLDLYVCNYVDFVFRESDRSARRRQSPTEQPFTLNPSAYTPQPNSLFRNNGDGTFDEVAAEAGVIDEDGRGLSAAWVDMDNDGWLDLYVANDVSNNGVFLNLRDGTFSDIGAPSLAGDYRGAMGIAVADIDDDFDQDLLVTHWIAQENALFRNMVSDKQVGASTGERVWFMDGADEYGFGQISLDMVGWANGFCDFDNDGRDELWLVNGSTLELAEDHSQLEPQPPFLFWNRGEEGYVDVAASALGESYRPIVGRGGAQLDFNRDGLIDWIVLVHGGDAMVLENTSPTPGHWIDIELRQTGGNTHAIGARVFVTTGGRTRMRTVAGGPSYLSQNEKQLHFGLNERLIIDTIQIHWPDGAKEIHTAIPANQRVRFTHAAEYPVQPVVQDSGVPKSARVSEEEE